MMLKLYFSSRGQNVVAVCRLGVWQCWGHQRCCAPSAKGAETVPACPSPGPSGCPCCPLQHPHKPVPQKGSVWLWGSAGSVGRGWCWGARGSAGTSTSRLVFPRCHHSSVFHKRGPRAPLPLCQALRCWVFLNFYHFYPNCSSVNIRCGEGRSVGEAGRTSPKVTNVTVKVGSFGQMK